MLNKLRSKVKNLFNGIALYASKLGFTPNALTLTSFLIALLGFFFALVFKSGTLLSLTILSSGFIDAIDGALARLKELASRRGAFLDSFIDRASEAVFALSLIELGLNVYVVVLFLVFSYLVSYARARGESLGVQLSGVGLMERAERIIVLALIAFLVDLNSDIAHYLYVVFTILTGVTVFQRLIHIWRALEP